MRVSLSPERRNSQEHLLLVAFPPEGKGPALQGPAADRLSPVGIDLERRDETCVCAIRGYCADAYDDEFACLHCLLLQDWEPCPAFTLLKSPSDAEHLDEHGP